VVDNTDPDDVTKVGSQYQFDSAGSVKLSDKTASTQTA
jgi:hypothetical protein